MEGITRTHNITVTYEMVVKGKKQDYGKCPAALAIKANFEVEFVHTTAHVTQWGNQAGVHTARHSLELVQAIVSFDEGGVFPPGVYQITERF